MKKLLAFGFSLGLFVFTAISAVVIRNVVDHGNGEYTMTRTSHGVDHVFRKSVDGLWTEFLGEGLPEQKISPSFANTLDLALAAYILGKNNSQTLTACPTEQLDVQDAAPAPQPMPAEPVLDMGDDEDDLAALAQAPMPTPAPDNGADSKKRSHDQDGSQSSDLFAKRKLSDRAEIGKLWSLLPKKPLIKDKQQQSQVKAGLPLASAQVPSASSSSEMIPEQKRTRDADSSVVDPKKIKQGESSQVPTTVTGQQEPLKDKRQQSYLEIIKGVSAKIGNSPSSSNSVHQDKLATQSCLIM